MSNELGLDFKSTTDKKLFIETYGCQMNVADSEVVASVMEMDGYRMTEKNRRSGCNICKHLFYTRQRRTKSYSTP